VQRFADLVGDARPIGVAGVDVGDAEVDDLAQHGQGAVVVSGRPRDPRTGQLHGAVAEPGDGRVAQDPGATGKRSGERAHASALSVELGGEVSNGSLQVVAEPGTAPLSGGGEGVVNQVVGVVAAARGAQDMARAWQLCATGRDLGGRPWPRPCNGARARSVRAGLRGD
jgi:hypothetical protein